MSTYLMLRTYTNNYLGSVLGIWHDIINFLIKVKTICSSCTFIYSNRVLFMYKEFRIELMFKSENKAGKFSKEQARDQVSTVTSLYTNKSGYVYESVWIVYLMSHKWGCIEAAVMKRKVKRSEAMLW